ncbi:hypothetical protein [Phytomonospora endophytica]|uniref:Uncharacterized protein n=1 Tax=Phytomonospora endophytica TaxID=714109 RepID=A0A841FV97_9ACTN|nr:hypothetical protein [Phytomonospora endophytica]MBB6037648.1 hypothetical protein [Phytomonospora endophytica]
MTSTNTPLSVLVGWFGRRHHDQLVDLLAEYRTSCPTRESGCVEDLAWAVHVAKRHVSSSLEEVQWAFRLLDRVGVPSRTIDTIRCPEYRCGL